MRVNEIIITENAIGDWWRRRKASSYDKKVSDNAWAKFSAQLLAAMNQVKNQPGGDLIAYAKKYTQALTGNYQVDSNEQTALDAASEKFARAYSANPKNSATFSSMKELFNTIWTIGKAQQRDSNGNIIKRPAASSSTPAPASSPAPVPADVLPDEKAFDDKKKADPTNIPETVPTIKSKATGKIYEFDFVTDSWIFTDAAGKKRSVVDSNAIKALNRSYHTTYGI